MALEDIHFQEGEKQDFIVEIPSAVYVGTITDIVVEPASTQYLLLDVPEINAGGGGNIFIMSE